MGRGWSEIFGYEITGKYENVEKWKKGERWEEMENKGKIDAKRWGWIKVQKSAWGGINIRILGRGKIKFWTRSGDHMVFGAKIFTYSFETVPEIPLKIFLQGDFPLAQVLWVVEPLGHRLQQSHTPASWIAEEIPQGFRQIRGHQRGT